MHNIEYMSFDESCNRQAVFKEINSYVQRQTVGEGGHGIDKIRWLDDVPVCKNEQEAEDVIKRKDRGWYDNLAVRYHAQKSAPETAREKNLHDKLLKQKRAYDEVLNFLYPEKLTSAMLTCKNCGSKLARTYLKNNFCPVCRTDLRPESLLKKINSAKEKYTKTADEYRDLMCKNGKIKWLVKYEYHT